MVLQNDMIAPKHGQKKCLAAAKRQDNSVLLLREAVPRNNALPRAHRHSVCETNFSGQERKCQSQVVEPRARKLARLQLQLQRALYLSGYRP